MTKTRISIPDDTELRFRLDQEYEDASQVQMCRYALMLAAHILKRFVCCILILWKQLGKNVCGRYSICRKLKCSKKAFELKDTP